MHAWKSATMPHHVQQTTIRLKSHKKSFDIRRCSIFLYLSYSPSSSFGASKVTEPLFYTWIVITMTSPCRISFVNIFLLVNLATAATVGIAITTNPNPAFSPTERTTRTPTTLSIRTSRTLQSSTPLASPTASSHHSNLLPALYMFVIFPLILVFLCCLAPYLPYWVGLARKTASQLVEIIVAAVA